MMQFEEKTWSERRTGRLMKKRMEKHTFYRTLFYMTLLATARVQKSNDICSDNKTKIRAADHHPANEQMEDNNFPSTVQR